MNLEMWFPQPIWFKDNDADFSEDIKFCKNLQKASKGRVLSNEGGWQSEFINIFDHKELSTVRKIIDETLIFILNQLDNTKFNSLTISGSWININNKYNYNNRHTHPECLFAGCIYLQVPENSGDINFYRPDNKLTVSLPQGIYDPTFYDSVKYTPKAGRVIVFPGWLEHDVSMSHSDEDRISIAFNIACK